MSLYSKDITPKHAKASFCYSPEVSLGQASTISAPIPRSEQENMKLELLFFTRVPSL